VGYALLVSALFMLITAVISIVDGHDSAFAPLVVSFLITFIVGIFPFIFVRKSTELSLKDGYLTIVFSWLLSFIFGMLPYALWGGPFTLENAWFESVSGFTTTGATILDNVESLPRSLLFWRSSTHFIGGLGVVVFLLLIIPNSSPVKMRLTGMELSSLSKNSYAVRQNKTVYIFAYVYLAIVLMAFLLYLLAGMEPFDAICHSLSVSSTGGFSTRNLSIASFDSRAVEMVTMFVMLMSSLHFGVLFLCVVNKSLKPLGNPVIKFYLISLAFFSIFVSVSLKLNGVVDSWGSALWDGTFQTLCVSSTTGFGLVDNAHWPFMCDMILISAGLMCGCAGSTTGGIKCDRIMVLFKATGCQVRRILHPSSVNEIRLGNRILQDEEIAPHLIYISLYFAFLLASSIIVVVCGVDNEVAFSGSLSCLSNIGPGMTEIGFMGNYNHIPILAKFIFSIDMFLGRVEIFPIMAVIAMAFDGKKR